jgi:osmotically inducible protein OsmC
MPTRTAQAEWNGSLADGNGRIKSATGAINQAYDWKSRAGDGALTNPEEMIAAAHAGCFAMALSHILGEAGIKATKINATAKVAFEKVGDGFGITRIDLVCEGVVPGIDDATFKKHAETAKANCPVSKALAAVKTITLDAKLAK